MEMNFGSAFELEYGWIVDFSRIITQIKYVYRMEWKKGS